jgi:5-formyltetrahydrofolate cyclo-ligase
VAEAKRALRQEILARRRALTPAQREAAGRAVAAHVVEIAAVRNAGRVALYAPTADEVSTRPLFEALASFGCRRLLPRISGDVLEFAAIATWAELRSGRLRLLAPPETAPAEALDSGDVVVVPGVAFGSQGQRLGRGGGYYDRTFATSGPSLIGIAFDLQLVDPVPTDSHDRAMDAIVTERGLRFSSGRV